MADVGSHDQYLKNIDVCAYKIANQAMVIYEAANGQYYDGEINNEEIDDGSLDMSIATT